MRFSIFIVVLAAGIIAIAVGWIYQSSSTAIATRPALEIPTDIDYFMTNFKYRSINQSGRLDFQLESPYLEHYTQKDVSRIDEPLVVAYQQNDNWRVESKIGELDHESNTMRLSDNVVMQKIGGKPMLVRSDSILFDPDQDQVVAEQGILVETPNSRISADEAVFDLNNQVYRLKRTKAVYYDKNI